MKFSLLYEMQLANPGEGDEARVFRHAVEQAELADKLGYHCIWAVEHHGLHQYSHSSAPETFLAFVAARTRNIRVGHGVALLPFRYNHPLRIAERVATLDVLSGGRVNFGTGKSASRLEQGAFGVKPDQLDAQWEEALAMILRCWQQPEFSHHSESFAIPPTRILPRPVQAPHPPLFVACTRNESVQRAGELGLGALNFSFGTRSQLAHKIRLYRDAIARARPLSAAIHSHFACAPAALVLPDDRTACQYGFRGARFFGDALEHYYRHWEPGMAFAARTEFLSPEALQAAMSYRLHDDDEFNVLCGDPAFAREYVARFRELGVDELILVMQMGTVPAELVLESVKTFGEQVLPHFA